MAQWVTKPRVSRRCRKQNPRRVIPPGGDHLPVGEIADGCSAQQKTRATRRCRKQNRRRVILAGRRAGGFGGSRRFLDHPGNPVVLAPGIGRKIAAHTGGKAASPIRGDIQGGSPLDHFCILFLREKDVPAPA